MNDLYYTISSSYFFHKSLSKEQRLSGMRWDIPQSKGRIMSGVLAAGTSYSLTEFITRKEFSVNYESENAKGRLLILNQLSDASYIQIKTQERFETDYSPRQVEMIVIPAYKNLTITYAPHTFGRRLEIFIDESKTEEFIDESKTEDWFSPDFLGLANSEDSIYFSTRLRDKCYVKLEELSQLFFNETFATADKVVAARIRTMLSQINALTLPFCC
jgi:hypothetical protein